MTFAYPALLWLLALPVLLVGFSLARRAAPAEVRHPRIGRGMLGRGALVPGTWRGAARPFAAALALACVALALARPQGGAEAVRVEVRARDVLVAVDVSRSMLAEDVAPSRLERARLLVRGLTDGLRGERLGLLPFAGTAFLQCPLSADYEIFRTFVDELGTDMIPAGGSDYAALLRVATEAFSASDSLSPDGSNVVADRYLIILSDGEAQDESWRPLAEALAGRGVRVIALGVGTAAGAMLPDGKDGLVKDSRGAAVLSRLQPATLRELARLSDGVYRDASTWIDLPALLAETVERGHAGRATQETAPRREEFFAWFLMPALVFGLIALGRELPVAPGRRRLRAAGAGVALAVAAGLGWGAPDARAAEGEAAPADPLVDLVGRLSAGAEPSAAEWAALAQMTVERGEAARQAGSAPAAQPPPEGALRDGLRAVEAGRRLAPGQADWADLRHRLEALLQPPPSPEQSSPKESNDSKDTSKPSPSSQKDAPPPSPSGGSPEKQPDASPQPSQSGGQSGSSPDGKGAPQPPPGEGDGSAGGSSAESRPDERPPGEAPSTPPPEAKPLGDLGSKPEGQAGDQPPADDRPPVQAGGVSASGRPAEASAEALANQDPAMVVSGQKLEQVRSSDSPARLFQLLQEAQNPREARSAAAPKQDW